MLTKLSLADSRLVVNALFLHRYHFLTDFESKRTDVPLLTHFIQT